MYCDRCGVENRDGAKFCINCGAELCQNADAGASTRVDILEKSRPTSLPKGNWDDWKMLFRKTVAQHFTSGAFVAMLICFTLVQILNLMSMEDVGVISTMEEAFNEVGISAEMFDSEMPELYNALSAASTCNVLSGVLVAVGVWLMFFGMLSKNDDKLQIAGLNIIYGVKILSLVLTCVLIGILFLFSMSITDIAKEYSEVLNDEINNAIAIFVFTLFLGGAVMILYQARVLATISAVRDTLQTAVPNTDVSIFAAVVCIASGALSIMSMFTMGFSFVGALEGVSSIFFGAQLFAYRGVMNHLRSEQLRLNAHP